jgi:hypothetical protein
MFEFNQFAYEQALAKSYEYFPSGNVEVLALSKNLGDFLVVN